MENKHCNSKISRFLFYAAVTASTVAVLAGEPPHPSVSHLMEQIKTHYEPLEEQGTWNDKKQNDLRQHLQELVLLYQNLKETNHSPYGGDPKAWKGFCDRSLGVLGQVQQVLDKGDWELGRKTFLQLAQIRDQAHHEFRPSLFKRLARLFGKKKQSP